MDDKSREILQAAIAAGDTELAKLFEEDVPEGPDSQKLKRILLADLYTERRKARLTQVDLAKKVGMSQSALARIESGKGNPKLSTLLGIAAALNVELGLRPRL
jgi:DNA-binding XRE family transcriptional regulator